MTPTRHALPRTGPQAIERLQEAVTSIRLLAEEAARSGPSQPDREARPAWRPAVSPGEEAEGARGSTLPRRTPLSANARPGAMRAAADAPESNASRERLPRGLPPGRLRRRPAASRRAWRFLTGVAMVGILVALPLPWWTDHLEAPTRDKLAAAAAWLSRSLEFRRATPPAGESTAHAGSLGTASQKLAAAQTVPDQDDLETASVRTAWRAADDGRSASFIRSPDRFASDGSAVHRSPGGGDRAGPRLVTPSVTGTGDAPIPLTILVILAGRDGSESLESIAVSGLLPGSSLTDGLHHAVAGPELPTVDISDWNLAALTFTPPAGFLGEITLSVVAESRHLASGARASERADLAISVEPSSDAPLLGAEAPSNSLVEAGSSGDGVTLATTKLTRSGPHGQFTYELGDWTPLSPTLFRRDGIYGDAVLDTASDTLTFVLDNKRPATEALVEGQIVTDVITLAARGASGPATESVLVPFLIMGSDDPPSGPEPPLMLTSPKPAMPEAPPGGRAGAPSASAPPGPEPVAASVAHSGPAPDPAQEAVQHERERAEALARELAVVQGELQAFRTSAAPTSAIAAAGAEASLAPVIPRDDEGGRQSPPASQEGVRSSRMAALPEPVPAAPRPDGAHGAVPSATDARPAEAARPRPAAALSASPDEGQLLARAASLLGLGDISAARLVLERAVDQGSARAAYLLAQTYDQRMLSSWGAHGIRGDADRARDYYARAYRNGIADAKHPLETLR